MNRTYESIIQQLKWGGAWKKVSADLSKISIKRCKKDGYGIFYNGIFTGIFILGEYINIKEAKEAGIKIEAGKMEY